MKKKGMYPHLVGPALKAHYQDLALRSENHGKFLDLFVDNKQVELVRNSDWQVIYGRRGTGKTFLLGVLTEECKQNLERLRILAVNISIQDCILSPVGKAVSDDIRALGYFQVFLEHLSSKIVDEVEELIKRKSLMDWLGGAYRRRVAKIEELALEILSFSQEGKPVAAFGTRVDSIKTSLTDSHVLDTEGHVKINPLNLPAIIGASLKGETKSQEESTESHETVSETVPRFAYVRQSLLALLETMQIHHLDVLIDEWSTLDPSGSTTIQPEFAELLKRTFAGTPKISIKIATNRYQTRFSSRGPNARQRGLELNADIFLGTNLDHALGTDEERWDFFSNLLYKRLLYCYPEVKKFEQRRSKKPDPQFIFSIFRDERAFWELIEGSDGIPREFLVLFNEMSRKSDFSVVPTWDVRFVRRSIWEKTAKQEEVEFGFETDQLLNSCIRPIVANTGTRLFLINKKERRSFQNGIEELLEKRKIHEYPRTSLPEAVRSRYDGFLVQYGLWLDWQDSYSRMDMSRSVSQTLTLSNDEQIEKFVVDLTVIDRENLNCNHCGASFRKETPSYNIRGLCPECFLPVG